ncbi:hypothetical protein D0B54_01265 [Solimonas sp. K1W22B-7]|uniref:hypothetical protein n=1 Tax=Solimonas sp. K1W22B-7 TaxID=2303331 RepID=UPI000E33399B|nr:hypothetical protein [Solimonas sp. K1W22B-7]AXQ27399.1 hypothetical protein D0B54_01265 [Solimonas sp. K1W22B-7]
MSMMPKLLLRDLALVAATVALVGWSHVLQTAASALHWPLAILAGALVAVSGYLAHEWGHLLGALSRGSRVELPPQLAAVFLFKFDSDRNDRRQFLAMSMGGFIASILVVALLLAVLDLHYWADRIALGLVVLGVAATFILEVPGAWKVYKGAPLPHGAAFVGGDTQA